MRFEEPWQKPTISECYWYHSMKFRDGTSVDGGCEITNLSEYLGGYPIKDKTMLDVGTASGAIAFAAELDGANVTGLDAKSASEFRPVPFRSNQNADEYVSHWERHNLVPTKKSWWYGWHQNKSKAKCIYAPHSEMYQTNLQFDIVVAGSIIEHLSDPVYSIGACARIAKEAVLIPFTDVVQDQALFMAPMTDWSDPIFNYAWWKLSLGLYGKVFANLGFDCTWVMGYAKFNGENAARPSIIARRLHT